MRPWLAGWVRSRELPTPAELVGAARVHVGHPDRVDEIVICDPARAPLDRYASMAALASASTWLSVPTADRWGTVADLERHGLTVDRFREWLMTHELAGHAHDAEPDGYRLRLETGAADLAVARVLTDDAAVAASGRVAIVDSRAVFDQIETAPDHRRRGLGRAVMSALADTARDRGARTGLLVASELGQRLYQRLGWRSRCEFVVGRTPT